MTHLSQRSRAVTDARRFSLPMNDVFLCTVGQQRGCETRLGLVCILSFLVSFSLQSHTAAQAFCCAAVLQEVTFRQMHRDTTRHKAVVIVV